MRDVLRQLAGSGRGQVFSHRAAAAVPVCVASVRGGSGEGENPLSLSKMRRPQLPRPHFPDEVQCKEQKIHVA